MSSRKPKATKPQRTSNIEEDDDSVLSVLNVPRETIVQTTQSNGQINFQMEKTYAEMEQYENKMSFIHSIIEDIRELADYHLLPLAEHLTPEDVEHLLEELKNA